MRILLVGSGGREHALAKALSRSERVDRFFCAPGNPGIATLAECVDIPANDVDGLVAFVQEHDIDLTVVGPEDPLVAGLADRIEKLGRFVFGPRAEAAALEGSKAFTKEILRRYRIPTAGYHVFDNPANARESLKEMTIFPVVVKADGLAAGKGVVIAKDQEEALAAVDLMMVQGVFGEAGSKIVVEEFLEGAEVSIHVVTDGRTLLPLDTVRDHKAAYDGNVGPNTGGMGTCSPSPLVTPELYGQIESQILVPTVHAMNREGRPFKGLLYAGLMVTGAGPRVLEYNVRFGDPEAQALLPRFQGDLVELMLATAGGEAGEARSSELRSATFGLCGPHLAWLPRLLYDGPRDPRTRRRRSSRRHPRLPCRNGAARRKTRHRWGSRSRCNRSRRGPRRSSPQSLRSRVQDLVRRDALPARHRRGLTVTRSTNDTRELG